MATNDPSGAEPETRERDVWQWQERDPFGRLVSCATATWARKVALRDGLAKHEAAIRATVRDPDAVYHDEYSTQQTRARAGGNPAAVVVHYVAAGRAHGKQQGNFVEVIVKLLPNAETGAVEGFVVSMLLPDRLRHRLQLAWERRP